MNLQTNTTVRMFGALHTIRKNRGLEPVVDVHIPAGGCSACELAQELELPDEKIEAVFVNHLVYGLDRIILPGDRVAFVPTGIPGPSRFMLGIYGAGQEGKNQ